MTSYKIVLIVATALIFWSSAVTAKRPQPAPSEPAPEVFSVKIEYSKNRILVYGANLDSATVTVGGSTVPSTPSDTTIIIPFEEAVSDVVDVPGNYVMNITTDTGNFTLTAFIPFAIVYTPPGVGGPCPCEGDWDYYGGELTSPNGFSGVAPSCASDTGDFVTVQFYDEILPPLVTNYWVLRTGWDASSNLGYCELWLDAPRRDFDTLDQFTACADYLRDTYVWTGVSEVCIF